MKTYLWLLLALTTSAPAYECHVHGWVGRDQALYEAEFDGMNKVIETKSWRECYTLAVNEASKIPDRASINVKDRFYEWELIDGRQLTSSGYVTKLSVRDEGLMAKGDQRRYPSSVPQNPGEDYVAEKTPAETTTELGPETTVDESELR